jgi:hypothetical protein
MPDGVHVTTQTNGTATVYRIGPDDQVSVSAVGYVTAKVAVSADRTATAVLQPTLATVSAQLDKWASAKQYDAIISWVFSPATGFRFTPSSSTTITGDEALWTAARDVVGKNVVAIVTLLPSGGVLAEDQLVEGMLGGNPSRVTIAGQPAWHGRFGQGMVGSLWLRRPLMIATLGSDLSTTDSVLAGIVAAQPTQ